uniref:Uncharacterized protein n=1 Tax=Chaetoceros debilis TaxID=122233 RepID=A0A7S3Q686_9STRA
MESLCSDNDSSISLATTSEECQHDRLFYEQFGATTLLYRHQPYYTHFDGYDCDYPGEILSPNNAESTSSARHRHRQGERMSNYAPEKVTTFHSDKPWEITLDTLDGKYLDNYASYIADTILHLNKKRLISQSPIVGKWMGLPNYTELERKQARRMSNFTRLRTCLDMSITPDDNETSESGMEHDPKCRSNDGGTAIGIDCVQEAQKTASVETADIKLQRMYTSPRDGYGIAPFRSEDIKFGLSLAAEVRDEPDNNDIPLKFQQRQKRLEDNPRFYGNCLKLLPCCCEFCAHANDVKEIEDNESQDLLLSQNTPQIPSAHFRSMFLLHPRGQSLAASKINFPMALKRSETLHGRESGNSIVDTGGCILQVELCYDADKTEDDENLTKFAIVRTPTHCSLISCEPRLTKNEENDKESRVTGCKGEGYILDEISRFDNRTGSRNGFEPFHVAVKHHQDSIYGGSEPSFAVVGREHESAHLGFDGANVIYHAKVQSDLLGQRHCIESLASISQIEFSGMNPLVLWASAREKTGERNLYKACDHNYHKRPIMGLGHSLHSIDLRSGHSNFTWSPSHDEYSMNAIHSVSGFAIDSDQQHSLFVSCASASKIYQVDARMPGQTVTSWGLPGLCDDNPSQNSPSGIYGSGMLLSKPLLEKNRNTVPLMVGVSKEPGCPCFHLLQGPSRLGRFQTQVLERTAHSGLDVLGDFASSSSFSLPDISESSFVSGIAAFYAPLSSISNLEDEVGTALCLISLTAGGDLYSHTLLPSLADLTGKSNFVSEGPIGSCAIALNDEDCSKEPDHQDFDLQWSTSNNASVPGRSILCNSKKRSFFSSQFCRAPPKKNSRENKRKIVQDVIALSHVNPPKRIVDPVRSQQSRTLLTTCSPKDDSQIFRRMPTKEKRYNATAQTDNLRRIINELRSNK